MKTRIEELWEEIQKEAAARPIADGGFKLLRLSPDLRFDVFGGVDASGCVMLAIGVNQAPPALKLESAALDYFRKMRSDGSWLMALRSRQPALTGVFGRLCQDLVDAMAVVSDEEGVVALFRNRLNLWQKLFDQAQGGVLPAYQIKGLIAELLVLESLLHSSQRSALEVVTAWVGPCGADQDFQFSDEAIEVKAIGPGADCISITSLQQLDALVPMRVIVSTMRPASAGESESVGLNSLVRRVESHIAGSPDALALLKGRLLEARYVENEHYDMHLFQPMSHEQFSVSHRTPKLTSTSVPRGIVAASYTIALNELRDPR